MIDKKELVKKLEEEVAELDKLLKEKQLELKIAICPFEVGQEIVRKKDGAKAVVVAPSWNPPWGYENRIRRFKKNRELYAKAEALYVYGWEPLEDQQQNTTDKVEGLKR